jgi:hypothetical protein
VERLRDKFEAEDRVLNLGVDQSILSISKPLYSFNAGDIVYKQELVADTVDVFDESIGHVPGKEDAACELPYRVKFNFRVEPRFSDQTENIYRASKPTCMLVVESLNGQDQMFRLFATAFFVGPTFLLTSGHILRAAKNIWLCIPGTPFVELDEVSLNTYAIRGTEIFNLYRPNGPPEQDIAFSHHTILKPEIISDSQLILYLQQRRCYRISGEKEH